jgi:hypothetical protein
MAPQGRRLAQRVLADAGNALSPDLRAAVLQGAARGIYVGEHKVDMSAAGRRDPVFSMANRNVGPLAVRIEFEPGTVRTSK